MKKDYNNTLVYYIRTLKEQRIIKDWSEGAKIYYELEGKEITATALSNRAKSILITQDINPTKLSDYYKYTPKILDKMNESTAVDQVEVKDGLIPEVISKALSVKVEDLGPVFGVDVFNDTPDVIRNKIMTKFGDDVFLLNYIGSNPGMFEIQKRKFGAWTSVLNLKDGIGKSTAEVIVNEKIEVTIVKRKNAFLYYTKDECDQWLTKFLSEKGITAFDLFDNNYRTSIKKDKEDVLNENLLMVIPGLEVHMGKLGAVSDFEDFSTGKAMWRVRKVWEEAALLQMQTKAGALVLGIGNDYFNSDTVDDKTTAGTPQNNDTRFKEVYLWGKVGLLSGVETLKSMFNKVIIKGNPGNHDEKSSFSLFTNIYDIYNLTKDPKVEVQFSFMDLRYTTCHEFGDNLIIFSHGKSPESKNLSDLDLAKAAKYQFPEEYNRARNVYVLAGHLHTDSEHRFDKVTVLRSAALSGIENWTANNLYLSSRQGATIYLFDKERGYVGKHNVTLTEKDKQQKVANINRNPRTNVMDAMEKSMDLDADKAKMLILAKKIKELDAFYAKKNKDFDARFQQIIDTLGITEYTEEQKAFVLKSMGYQETLELANLEMEMVKRETAIIESGKTKKLVLKPTK